MRVLMQIEENLSESALSSSGEILDHMGETGNDQFEIYRNIYNDGLKMMKQFIERTPNWSKITEIVKSVIDDIFAPQDVQNMKMFINELLDIAANHDQGKLYLNKHFARAPTFFTAGLRTRIDHIL